MDTHKGEKSTGKLLQALDPRAACRRMGTFWAWPAWRMICLHLEGQQGGTADSSGLGDEAGLPHALL